MKSRNGLPYLITFLAIAWVLLTASLRLDEVVLGILVVLVSWTAVNFVVVALSQGRGGFGQMANIFGNQWNRGP